MQQFWKHGQRLQIDSYSKGTKVGIPQSPKGTIKNLDKEEG